MVFAEIRAQAWKWGCIAFAVLAVAAVAGCLFFQVASDRDRARADSAETRAKGLAGQLAQAETVIAAEREHALSLWRVGAQYEQDKADAQIEHDRVVAGLRAGNLQLRNHWQGCRATSEAVSATGQPDGEAELRAAGAGDLVRLADEADAQVRGLQAVIEADRK